ncbi:MAG TPA: rhombosortase [Gammaproteobacteria bacterium]|nr:rhombosortase [Gammaproteobacteria bacterium]
MTPDGIPGRPSVAAKRLRDAWPVLGLLLACLALAAAGDEWRELGRYDRDALAAGEYWRLVSGHLVHLGWGHVWPNVAALVVIGLLFEGTLRNTDWLLTALVAAGAIDLGLFFLDPGVRWYVGLSGVLHGFVAAGAFQLLLRRQALGAILGAGLAAKIVFEQTVGPVPLTAGAVGGPVIVAAHLYGAAGGLLAAAAARFVRSRRSRV